MHLAPLLERCAALRLKAPHDAVTFAALLGAALLLVFRPAQLFGERSASLGARRSGGWLAVVCCAGFALSYGYLRHYLRGGPRIIDATSYFLEARSFAAGHFTFDVPSPTAAFRGRFLVASGDGHRLGVLFPPGYPLILALGFVLGAPLLVGPFLGAALVLATYLLALRVSGRRDVARLSALLSLSCAALRYHTADTMSHGLCALLLTFALWFALRAGSAHALGAGLCVGLLFAARPVSGAVSALVVLLALGRAPRAWLACAAGALPGVGLLLAHQHALTGLWWSSTQLAYYAVADAPAGCFSYGFGRRIGCHFEHGDFVDRYLPNGYGLAAAARNVAVRLGLFTIDVSNAAPLTLLAPLALLRSRKTGVGASGAKSAPARRPQALLLGGVALQCLAYAPFYFEGSYPGGGARLLTEVIPLAQIAIACAAFEFGFARCALPLSLAGFACHAALFHEALRDREGGRPMFEPARLAERGIARGLVFVTTDHAFNLGHEPSNVDAAHGLVVARSRGDAHDRVLYERLGRPPSYRYAYAVDGSFAPGLLPFVPPDSKRFEGEAGWPPLSASGPAYPTFIACAKNGAALRLLPGTVMDFELPQASPAGFQLGWASTGSAGSEVEVELLGPRLPSSGKARQIFRSAGPGCSTWRLESPPAPAEVSRLRVRLSSGAGALDFVEARPFEPRPH